MALWVPLSAICEPIHRRICPLYTFDYRNRPYVTGTAVPFRIGEFRFLLTAAHACFDSSKTPIPLFTIGATRPHALRGRRGAWEYVPARTPDIDLAVMELEGDAIADLEAEYQFSTPADTSTVKPKTPGIHYLIAGYPAERNRIRSLNSLPSLATYLITGDIQNTCEMHLDKLDATHFALGLPGRVVPKLGGGRFRVPKVQGMSGGGVWRIEIDIPRQLATTPLLVGAGIEYHKTKQLFIVTRVQTAIPLIMDLMRLSEGLPLDR
jgi:hypothetical protein